MKATLVNYSVPTQELIAQGIDDVQEMISFCARVSNPAKAIAAIFPMAAEFVPTE